MDLARRVRWLAWRHVPLETLAKTAVCDKHALIGEDSPQSILSSTERRHAVKTTWLKRQTHTREVTQSEYRWV